MIELHQMLHGYKLGHNYVQGSILLPSSHDMDKIATLSDWSEFVDKGEDRDYITAYPLLESPYYVIAKSWYADEMRRPGCVWTHSLLIKRNDLGKIIDYRQLLTLFKRPAVDKEDFLDYSKSIALNEKSIYLESKGYPCLTEAKVSELYAAMLSPQPVCILKEIDNTELQELLLNLYNYLPSGLLWQQSLCSGTALPRSYEGQLLSLQFVTHDGGNVIYLNNKIPDHGSQLVAVSLLNGQRQLPELIRYFEVELCDDERRLRGFLEVVVLVNRRCKNEDEKQQVLLSIISQLSETFPQPTDGDNIKRSVLQPSLSKDLGGEENFLYTISTINVSSFTAEQIGYIQRLHDLSSEQFLRLLKQLYSSENLNEWGKQTVKSIDHFVSYAEIARLRQSDKVLFQTIISSNTELLNQIVWTEFSKEELETREKQLNATAEEMYQFFKDGTGGDAGTGDMFGISDEYSEEDALKIMAVRYNVYLSRFSQYMKVTIANEVSEDSIAAIEEASDELTGIDITENTMRVYNNSESIAHIIGYTGFASEDELETLNEGKEEDDPDYYSSSDVVGKDGIEKLYESYLHGASGSETMLVDKIGKVLEVTDEKEPGKGNDITLTIDSKLQKYCYDLIESKLAGIIL